MAKRKSLKESSKLTSAIAHDKDSRNSVREYMETGNPAEKPALVRALRNNDNGSHM
jgi:hypothetical protein